MTTKQYWTLRLARPDDLDRIMQLVRAVHGEAHPELDQVYWRWRYIDHDPAPAEVAIAEHEDQVICILPSSIFDFQRRDVRLKGRMLTGAMTHPEHQRRGIYATVLQFLHDRNIQTGVRFHMGTPNDVAMRAYRKYGGWEYPGVIPTYFKTLNIPAILSAKVGRVLGSVIGAIPQVFVRGRGNPLEAGVAIQHEHRVPDEVDGLTEQFVRDCGTLMIRRTAAYFNWRFCMKPRANYRTLMVRKNGSLLGVVVTGVQAYQGIPVGLVLDFLSGDGLNGLRQLIRAAETDLKSREVGLVTCQASTPLLQRALVEEAYSRPKKLPKQFHYIFYSTGLDKLPEFPREMADWHITYADSDNT